MFTRMSIHNDTTLNDLINFMHNGLITALFALNTTSFSPLKHCTQIICPQRNNVMSFISLMSSLYTRGRYQYCLK